MKGCRLLIGVFDPSNLVRSSRRRRASGVRLRDEHRLSSLLRRDARDSSARRGLDPRRRRVANRAHRRVPRPRGRRRGARDAGRQDASRAIIAIIRENGGFRGRTRRESGRRRAFDDGVSRVLARVRPMTRREKTRAHVPFVSGRFATRRDADGGRRRRNPRQPIRERFRDGVGVQPRRRRVARTNASTTPPTRRNRRVDSGRVFPTATRTGTRATRRSRRSYRPSSRTRAAANTPTRRWGVERPTFRPTSPRDASIPRGGIRTGVSMHAASRLHSQFYEGHPLEATRPSANRGGGTRARPRVVPPHRRGSPFARRLVGRAIREREWAT